MENIRDIIENSNRKNFRIIQKEKKEGEKKD